MSKRKLSKEERSSIGRRNRGRGFAFERKICKKLQEFWDPEEKRGKFTRSVGSGGSIYKKSHDMAGDVTTVDKTFPLHCELKNSSQWKDFQQCLTATKWAFWDYLDQAERDCPKDKIPVVIMTQPGSGTKTFIAGRMQDWLFSDHLNDSHFDFPMILLHAQERPSCWVMEFSFFLSIAKKMLELGPRDETT